jgi:hypothetical protein
MAPLGVRARFRALLVGLLLAAGAGAGSGSQSAPGASGAVVAAAATAATAATAAAASVAASSASGGGFLPPGSASAGGIYNMVLVYTDARSFAPGSEFNLSSSDWVSLLMQCEAKLFDAVLFTGYTWTDSSCFWPVQCQRPLNATDWASILALWTGELGARGLSDATSAAFGPGATTKAFVAIPYPDERAESFGRLGGGRELNLSVQADRVEAACWWARAVRAAVAPLPGVELAGMYWYLEGTTPRDIEILPQVGACVRAAGLKFAWIPDYADGVEEGQAAQWRALGFDFATLQPNYAFYDVTTQRFANTSAAMAALGLGVEMEVPMTVRNTLIDKNSTQSFYAYLDAAVELGWSVPGGNGTSGALKTWYSGNDIALYSRLAAAGNASMAQRLDDIRALVNGDYVPPGGPPRARGARATASPRCRRAPGREKEPVKT